MKYMSILAGSTSFAVSTATSNVKPVVAADAETAANRDNPPCPPVPSIPLLFLHFPENRSNHQAHAQLPNAKARRDTKGGSQARGPMGSLFIKRRTTHMELPDCIQMKLCQSEKAPASITPETMALVRRAMAVKWDFVQMFWRRWGFVQMV